MKLINFSMLAIISLLVACGPTTSPETIKADPQALLTSTRHPTPSPVEKLLTNGGSSPVATPVIDSGSSPIATPVKEPTEVLEEPPPGTATLITKAKEMLIQVPGIEVTIDDIALVAAETRQWRDSSLGCPRKGMMYNYVITPGYLIVLRTDGREYEFHTNSRETVVLCLIDGEDALKVLQQ